MNLGKLIKKLYRFAINNYFIAIFFASIAFVGVVSLYKLFFVKPTYVYAKVKMGQGLWWASTQKPSMWFIESLKKTKEEYDLLGQPQAQILSIRYYPWWVSNQYDVYLIMKLKVSRLGKTGKYNFKRSSIGVGSPVDFDFPQAAFSGTIIEISEKPIKENYQEKIIYLSKPYAYSWEYEGIKIGDKYFDGEETVVEILEKSAGEISSVIAPYKSIINPALGQTRRDLFVKLKIKGRKIGSNFIFGEEQIIAPGKTINIATDNFQFTDYLIAGVE